MSVVDSVDAVVIGAGVVGLAIARELARAGEETVVLERGPRIGAETSSRNSGVIHAGIHYTPGSLKARLCVRGRELLYAYLSERGLPHSRCGKLVVALDLRERAVLEQIRARAIACGVTDLGWLDATAIRALEPEVQAEAALLSPSTGIVDAGALMLSLRGDLEAAGGVIAFASPVVGGRLSRVGLHEVDVGGESPSTLACRRLVNASGLAARETLLALACEPPAPVVPPQYFAKGHYYAYSGVSPFRRLVYPVPQAGGLGVHATLDLGGQLRFGPDFRWVDAIDYGFDDSERGAFAASIRRWFPALDPALIQPDHTGIRPRIAGPGEPNADFAILSEAQHGIRGFCSLHGIESPGLTAALAIGAHVAALS